MLGLVATKPNRLAFFSEEWRQAGDNAELRRQIAALDPYYDYMGELGDRFRKAVQDAAPREVIEHEIDTPAYVPYTSFPDHQHFIKYPENYLTESISLLDTRFHEMTHVFQHQNAPILHAITFNPVAVQAGVMLTPRAYLTAGLMQEQDAKAKECWLTEESMDAVTLPIDDALDRGFAYGFNSMSSFAHIKGAYPGHMPEEQRIRKALRNLAYTCLDTMMDTNGQSLAMAYMDQFLTVYEYFADHWLEFAGDLKPRFVELTDEDRISIGDSFGPNPFTNAQGQLMNAFKDQYAELPPEIEARILELNERIGYDESQGANTLEDALKPVGWTKKKFLHLSLNQ